MQMKVAEAEWREPFGDSNPRWWTWRIAVCLDACCERKLSVMVEPKHWGKTKTMPAALTTTHWTNPTAVNVSELFESTTCLSTTCIAQPKGRAGISARLFAIICRTGPFLCLFKRYAKRGPTTSAYKIPPASARPNYASLIHTLWRGPCHESKDWLTQSWEAFLSVVSEIRFVYVET